jgi:2-haloacid dehalogenase
MTRFCAFDIYGTLFDMRTVMPTLVGGVPDPEEFYRLWRVKLLHYLWITSAVGTFVDLPVLREKAFDFCVQELAVHVGPDVKKRFVDAALYLNPFGDVRAGLERLRQAGLKIVALSTGTKDDLLAMFDRAKMTDWFDAVITNKEAGIYKPHPRAYTYAAERLGAAPGEIRMVAAHPWDLIGARHAGLRPAWLRRAELAGLESRTYDPIDETPDLVAGSLTELVEKLIAADLRESTRRGGTAG